MMFALRKDNVKDNKNDGIRSFPVIPNIDCTDVMWNVHLTLVHANYCVGDDCRMKLSTHLGHSGYIVQ